MTERERIEELISTLNKHTELYDAGTPEIADADWDSMYFELVALENSSGIYLPNSPTQNIHYSTVLELNKVKHSHPMLSLDKTKDINKIASFLGKNEFVAMAKMDGLTCSLTYEGGKLIRAETRGNGIVGEDITHNAMVIKNIPKKIAIKTPITFDGEIISTKANFEKFKGEYQNERNFAAGSIRLLSNKECETRGLIFVCWDIISEDYSTLEEKLLKAMDCRFTVVPYVVKEDNSVEELETTVAKIKEACHLLGYPIDGLVFKFNDCELYESMGRTAHHFSGGLALKSYDELYETKLIDITYDISRNGTMVPVAIFDTVNIDGADISRASLHNLSVLNDLSGGMQFKGDTLYIYRANMIIPQIDSWEHNDEDATAENRIEIPKYCPICGKPTTKKVSADGVVSLLCTNDECPRKLINRLNHFAGKANGLDIKGLSAATFEKLIEFGWLEDIDDIFELHNHRSEWIKKAGFGPTSVDKILKAIEDSKNCDLSAFISAIGIPLIGKNVAKEICKYVISYEEFRKMIDDDYDFSKWDSFGYEKAKSIKSFDYSIADKIVEKYLNIKEIEKEEKKSNSLEGITVCITGKLSIYPNRDALVYEITSRGGKVTSSVSSKVNWLITNTPDSGTQKNITAQRLGIPIITEEEFQNRMF